MKWKLLIAASALAFTAGSASADDVYQKCQRGSPETVQECCNNLTSRERRELRFDEASCEKNMVCATNFGGEGYSCYLLRNRERGGKPDQRQRDYNPR